MTTGLLVILMFGGALCGWALLSVMGAERQRQLNELEAKRAATPPATPPSPFAPPTKPGAQPTAKLTSTKPSAATAPAAAKPAKPAKNTR